MTAPRRFRQLLLLAPLLCVPPGCSVEVSSRETVTREDVAPPMARPRPRALLASAPPPPETNARLDTDAGPGAEVGAGADADAGPEADDETDEQAWQSIRAALDRPGDLRDGVLTFSVPRDDLEVTVQGNDVPVAAGLWSEFRFWRCPCGLINVAGQFLVADYESNDVIDALREGHIEIASVGPFLVHERPRLVLVRFLGENKRGGNLAKTLRTALSWTGEERLAPQKIDLPR